MFYFRQENFDQKYPKFRVLKAQKDYGIQNYTLYENLDSIIETSMDYPQYQHFFLLDEQRFDFFCFEIRQHCDSKITYSQVESIIAEKIQFAKTQTKSFFLFSQIDDIKINGIEKKFLIGEKGEISFRLMLIYLKNQTCLEFDEKYGNFSNQKNLEIFPQTFQTIQFLKKNIKSEKFLLLYIRDSHCKAIVVENGAYQKIETINLGVNTLMQIYRDNGISKYRYKNYEEIENNPFAKDLVIKTLEFYAEILCKRIKEMEIGDRNIFVISPIMKNVHFMEIFNKEYHKHYNNYIVPFHYSNKLDLFGKQREPEDIDALIFINTRLNKEKESFIKQEKF